MYIIVMLDTEPEMEESSYKLELSRAHSIVWQVPLHALQYM